VAVSNGVASFSNIIIDTTGNPYTLIASTDTGQGTVTSAASNGINVVAPELVVTTEPPSSVTAGRGVGRVVTGEAYPYQGTVDTAVTGSVTLSINSGPSGAPITGNTAVVVNGVATFSNVVLTKAGTYILKASDGDAIPGLTTSITVGAQAAVAQL